MILGTPAADLAITDRRDVLLKQRAAISAELAHVELRLAADVLRQIFGTAAVWLLVDKDSDDGDSTDINLLVVLDRNHQPLWFNSSGGRYDSNDYPGAHDVADGHGRPYEEMAGEAQTALIRHLTAAYDAVGGVTGAWFPSGDDFYGLDFNVLCLSIPAAFDPYTVDDPDKEPTF